MNVAIIGAGISGLSVAVKCKKNNINYIIYEKEDYLGGLWNIKKGIVNEYSNIQVPSPTFKFEDDKTKYSEYTKSEELYSKIEENYKNQDIVKNIIFKTKLKSFKSLDNNKVELILENLETNEEFIKIYDGLYIRTGTLNK